MVVILKIGGSVITDKSRLGYARKEEIERIAVEIAGFQKSMVLVHGAGSFGHIPARRFGLPDRFDPRGLLITHRSVCRLNEIVLEALCNAGAAPLPVHPLGCTVLREGRIDRMDVSMITQMLQRGILPVLHGDVAMDAARGSWIVSGDQLVSFLAIKLNAEMAALGTDVDGLIFQGSVVPRITGDDLSRLDSSLSGSSGVDVTGGMRGKVLELLSLADDGVSSIIFNASKPGNVLRALQGEHVGTAVTRRS